MTIDERAIAQKTTLTLFAAQSFGSAGFIAASTINAIVGAELSHHPAWAGVPAGVYQVGSALAAFGWGYGMERLGRRGGLTLGLIFGVIGASVASVAVITKSFWFFLGGMVLMGAANAALQLARFAAAEVHPPAERGRAISNVVLGGTVGAVFGPLMVGPMGTWSSQFGYPELAGPYVASLVLFIFGAIAVTIFLRPDPRDVGRVIAQHYPQASINGGLARTIPEIVRQPATIVAMIAMVIGQVTMVMLMVITSLHMKDHQHALGDISFVISSHTFGMFAFSIVSGRLADRFGRAMVICVGALTLILACLTAPLSPDVLPISVALFLLGLGWNFCYVGGSTLLSDQLSPDERSRTQGLNDLIIGLVSAFGSLSSGVIFATFGYATVGVMSAFAAAIPFFLTMWWSQKKLASVRG